MDDAPADLRAAGEQLERLLDRLRATLDVRAWELVEEAIGLVTDLYGAGLGRVLELVSDDDVQRLAGDDLVASLLVLHGLHPSDLEQRVTAAIESVRPYMDSHGGDVEVLGIDEDAGVVHLRMLGSCDGCPSSSVTLQLAVKDALERIAPEIVHIEVVDESPPPPPPVFQVELTRKPVASR
ncbi:MAG: putative nitrogen fixation protein [Ilumatobacteraceae bacterium]|nr:putative nitrogen fixation protein [Ilumatobacteraceae bacterium]